MQSGALACEHVIQLVRLAISVPSHPSLSAMTARAERTRVQGLTSSSVLLSKNCIASIKRDLHCKLAEYFENFNWIELNLTN